MTNETLARVDRLRAIALRESGKTLPEAHIDDEDWQDYYPLVSADGILTGQIVDSQDPDVIVVEWCEQCRLPRATPWACEAAIEEAIYAGCPHDQYDAD